MNKRLRSHRSVLNWGAVALMLVSCAGAEKKSKTARTPEERSVRYVAMANATLMAGDAAGAIPHYDEAIRLNPDNSEAHHGRGMALAKRLLMDPAIASLRTAIEVNAADSAARTTLGKYLMDQGKEEEALKQLKIAANDPTYRQSWKPMTNIGLIYIRQGELTRAEKAFTRAIRLSPMLACQAYFRRGKIREARRDMAGAVEDFDQASVNYCGRNAEAHYAKAMALIEIGKSKEAKQKLLSIREMFPDHAVSRQALEKLRNIQ